MPEHLTAAGTPARPPSPARRTAPPTPGLLALQRAAGNRAVTALLTPKPTKPRPDVVVQRRPWLDEPKRGIYRDKAMPHSLAYIVNAGGTHNLGVFMDQTRLAGFQAYCAGKVFHATWMVGSTHPLHEGFRAAVGTVWQEQNTAGRPLVVVNPWGEDGIGVVRALIALGEATGPFLRNEGGGSRLPFAQGTLYFDNTWTNKDDVLQRGFGIKPADLAAYVGVTAAPTQDLSGPKLAARTDRAQFAEGPGYIYVSTVVARPRAGRKPRLNGTQYNHSLTDPAEILRLNNSYESIRAAPVSTGWVDDLHSSGRDGSQDKAMKDWSAYGAAAFHNAHRGGKLNVDADNWEWLHIRGAQIGGETDSANLLAGTFSANSQMIPYESQLERWHRGNHGKIWARFSAVARDMVLAERIVIEVCTDRHRELGTIPANEPLRVEFSPLTGGVVDKLIGRHRGQDWRREARLRGRHPGMNQLIALGPPPLLRGTGMPSLFSVRMPLPRFTTFVPLQLREMDRFFTSLERTRGTVTLSRSGRPLVVLRNRQDALRFGNALGLPLTGKRRAAEAPEGVPGAKRTHIALEPPVESMPVIAMDSASMEEYEVQVTIPATALTAEPSFLRLPWLNPYGGNGPPPPTGGGIMG